MWAAQFRPPSLILRAMPQPPTPPHPLEVESSERLGASVPITRSFFNGHVSPAAPPSSPIPPCAPSPGPFDYMECTLSPDTNPSGMTRWNGLLQNFLQGRAAGRNVCDYIPFNAIAPCYLPLSVRAPAWILDQIRGEIPFEMIKLR